MERVLDPETYVRGVPYDRLAELREQGSVRWAESGFWVVLGHAEVRAVLKDPKVFSSQLGATQIRDPATPEDLRYVRRMMLNLDPPEHTRLRGLLTKAFTPRALAAIADRVQAWAYELVGAVARDGECDFAKVAADLPLLTLAKVFGVPEQDRGRMFDWSNRVICYQDPEYAVSSTVDPARVSDMGRAALALAPRPVDGVMPDPRTRAGMLDLYAYAHALGEYKRANPGSDVMSDLMRQDVGIEEFENLFWLFSVAGNETLRNGIPGGLVALMSPPGSTASCWPTGRCCPARWRRCCAGGPR